MTPATSRRSDTVPRSTDLVVFATARAKPGRERDLERALRDVAEPTRAQPGCVDWTLYRVADDPGVLIAVERWASSEEHDRHLQGAHVQTLMAAMADVLAEPPKIVAHAVVDG